MSFAQLLTSRNHITSRNRNAQIRCNGIFYFFSGRRDNGNNFLLAFLFNGFNLAINISHKSLKLRRSDFENFFNSRQTHSDISSAGNTSGMESSHSKLSTRFSNGLSSNNTYSLAHFNKSIFRQIITIAKPTNASKNLAFNK